MLGPREITNALANILATGHLSGSGFRLHGFSTSGLFARVPTLTELTIHVMDSDTLFSPSTE
jgi:hypothetical protein